MVKELNGSTVHKSECEAKHPQLERQQHKPDAQSFKDARPARVEPLTVFVGGGGFFDYNNSMEVPSKKSPMVGLTVGTVTVSTS